MSALYDDPNYSDHPDPKDFCFVCEEGEDGDTYAVVTPITHFRTNQCVDDHYYNFDEILPDDIELATDATYVTLDRSPEELRQVLLGLGFVELPEFTEWVKHNHPV